MLVLRIPICGSAWNDEGADSGARREALEHIMDRPTADDQTAVDQARWLAGANGWWGDAEEPTASLIARIQELDDSKAEMLPFLRPRLLQPGLVTGRGGRLAYLAQLSEDLYAETQDFPVGDGPVEAIWNRLLGQVINSEVACAEARTLGRHGDLIAPYAQVLAIYLAGSVQTNRADPAKALLLATVVLAMAEAQQPGTDTSRNGWTAWRWAANAYVEVSGNVLCRQADVNLYNGTRRVADSVVQWGTERDSDKRSESLALLGHFLLTPFSANAGFLQQDDPWRQVQNPMQPGNPRSTYALREAASALDGAVATGKRQVSPRTWLDYVTAQDKVAMFDPDASRHKSHVDSAVSAARLALDHITGESPGMREYIEQILQAQLSEQAQLG